MSVRTRVDAPRRAAKRGAETTERRAMPRRVHEPDHAKSGAAKRAYTRRRNRLEGGASPAPLPGRAASAMSGRIPFVAAIIALLGCGLMCTLLLTTRSAEDSYQLGDARKINQQLSDEQAELQRQVAAADSAPELASRARDLGMIPAKDPARLLIAPDGTVTVVGKETEQLGPPAPPLNTSPAAPTAAPPNLVQAQGERLVPVTPGQNQNPAAPRNPATQAATQSPGAQTPPAQSPAAQDVAAQAHAPAAPAQRPAAPAAQSPAPAAPAQSPAPAAPVDRPAPASNPAPAVRAPAAQAPAVPVQTPAPRPAPPAGGGQ